jgi:hypothetical protein
MAEKYDVQQIRICRRLKKQPENHHRKAKKICYILQSFFTALKILKYDQTDCSTQYRPTIIERPKFGHAHTNSKSSSESIDIYDLSPQNRSERVALLLRASAE